MDYKKTVKPLSRITLFVLLLCLIYKIVKLFEGEGNIIDVIWLICIMVYLFVVLPTFGMKKPKPLATPLLV